MIQHLSYVASGGTVAPSDRPPAASTIKLAADYASKHGVTLAELKDWKWTPVDCQPYPRATLRPAFKFETESGPRYRFLDKGKQRFTHAQGYQICWYGLTDDVVASIDSETPLVICNGEISTVAGQTHLIPAVCITSGEKSRIPDNLLAALKEKIQPGARVIVAFDCDPTGRKAGPNMAAQLIEAGYDAWAVDLGLGDKGDLADFVVLHGAAAYQRLMECPRLAIPEQARPAFTPRPSAARPNKPANVSRDIEERADQRRHAWYKKAWDGIIRTLETTSRGRNTALFSAACKLFDLVESYPQYNSESAAYDALYNASSTNGYLAKDGRFAVNGAIKSAQRTPRQYVDMPFDPYDFSDAQRADRVGENTAKSRQENADLEQVFRPYIEHYTTLSTLTAFPDAVIKHSLKVFGLPVVSEANYLFGAIARGQLPAVFTIEHVNAARTADGIETPAPVHVYTDMVKYGLLEKVSADLIDGLHPIPLGETKGCNPSINSRRGRKCTAYSLVSLSDYKRAMFRPMAAALVAMHPETPVILDKGLIPLVQAVLEGLLLWKQRYQSLTLGMVQGFLKDTDKHRAAEVYEAVLNVPITDAGLIACMGFTDGEAVALSSLVLARADAAMQQIIGLKNRLLLRLYQTHLDDLENPHTTPLPDGAPRVGEAWLDAFYNALLKPYSGTHLWNYQLNAVLGIENKRSAKRAAHKAGVVSAPREETRAFTVTIQGDSTPTWNVVRQAARDAAKQGEAGRAQHIRSYDERGRLVGTADIAEADPYDFNVGVRFEVVVQLPNLITVADIAPLAAEQLETDTTPQTDETPIEAADTADTVTETRRARITPARLHDRTWLLARLLAPFCQTADGVWYSPLTGEIHEDAEALLKDAMSAIADTTKAV